VSRCILALFVGCAFHTAAAAAAPDFETGVLPVLTKAGCNGGACHGAAIGRGGFRLSLLGYDPQADYESILQEFEGRRANLVHPEKSLLLRKPGGLLPHEGGVRLKRSSEEFQTVLSWLRAGAPRGPTRMLAALELAPRTRHLDGTNQSFALRVHARFADGSHEDVTRLAVYTPRCAAHRTAKSLSRAAASTR
jgi:hypothetical protein